MVSRTAEGVAPKSVCTRCPLVVGSVKTDDRDARNPRRRINDCESYPDS